MTRFWAERAWLGDVADRVLIEVDGERISAVTPGAEAPDDSVRLYGLVLPGLANAHSHAFHRALRGRAEIQGADFWGWREVMYELAASLEPDSYHQLASAVYAEMALAGITAVGEFHYLHHAAGGRRYENPNAMGEALIEAAKAAGVRMTLLDTCYLRGGFDAPLEGAQLRFGDGDAAGWAARAEALKSDASTIVGAAIHSVRAVDPEGMAAVATWAREREAPLHVHLLERKEERLETRARLMLGPVDLLASAGVLGARTTVVHATHVAPVRPFKRLLDSGTGVCICRTTERDLADGHVEWQGRPRLSFGSDSHAVIDIFEEARAFELDQRSVSGVRGTYWPKELLHAATTGGYEALGWDGGRLEAGALADFIAVDMQTPRTAGAPGSEAATLVFAATAADVTDVVVGGRQIVKEGRHLEIENVGGELAAAITEL